MKSCQPLNESLEAGIGDRDLQRLCGSPQHLDELNKHWAGLQYLGLELTFSAEALQCRHRGNGFDFVIPYDRAGADELRRQLFSELRKYFGSFSDRHLAALFQPSHQVEILFASFSALLPLCRNIATSS